MSTESYDRKAACPFYQGIFKQAKGLKGIVCECVIDNLGFEVMTGACFRSIEEMDDYFGLFCMDRYGACPYFKIISRKYEKEAGGQMA